MEPNQPRHSKNRLSQLITRSVLYTQQSLRADLIAGLTVAMVAIPQSMSYAAIAGVNPIYGLYTAIVPAIAGALFGSSNHLVTGPTNATALVTAGVLLTVAGSAGYIEFVFALAVISGLVKLILGLLKLGGITRYVSNSVLTGFLAGAGVLIIINQLGNLLGLPGRAGASTLASLWDLVHGLSHLNSYALATGLFAIAILLLSKRLYKNLPAALLAIGLASVLVQVTSWHPRGVTLVSDQGSLKAGLSFHVPGVNPRDMQMLLTGGGAVAFLSLVESISVAKAIGLSSGQRINPSEEFVGQGLASIVGGFFQCIPSSGSPSRSAINHSNGAETRLAAAFSGGSVLLAMLAFAPLIGYIPVASLAGVVIVSAYNMINCHYLKMTWRSRMASRVVLGMTFIATLLLPLHIAIYLGALLSIGIYLYESSNLQLSYLTLNENGEFVEHSLEDILCNHPSIALINVGGALYFGAVDDLEKHLEEVLLAGVKVVILRVRRTRLLASTGVTALERLCMRANQLGITILLCGITDEIEATLASSGINSLFDTGQIFKVSDTLFESTRQALQRAREIVTQDKH